MNYILLLGGNIGDRETFLKNASERISIQCGNIINTSSIYETAAWGVENQPNFYNQVLKVESNLEPAVFLDTILLIEKELGRIRFKKWGERVIDIDILFIDDLIIKTSSLTVPHPQLHNRRFTLVPLLDISEDYIHPLLKASIIELLNVCPDPLEVSKVVTD